MPVPRAYLDKGQRGRPFHRERVGTHRPGWTACDYVNFTGVGVPAAGEDGAAPASEVEGRYVLSPAADGPALVVMVTSKLIIHKFEDPQGAVGPPSHRHH